jgi:hypothetical protein
MKNPASMIGFLVVFITCLSAEVIAKDLTSDRRATLKGIKSMTIVVEEIKQPETTANKLTKEIIEKDVSAKLQEAGISVVSFTDLTSDLPWVYVNIHLMDHKELPGFYTFNLGVEIRQFVILKRITRLSFNAATWEHRLAGMISSTEAVSTIRRSLNEVMDSFVDDYRAVNPAKEKTEAEKPEPQN